jgi:hypothetical protein
MSESDFDALLDDIGQVNELLRDSCILADIERQPPRDNADQAPADAPSLDSDTRAANDDTWPISSRSSGRVSLRCFARKNRKYRLISNFFRLSLGKRRNRIVAFRVA